MTSTRLGVPRRKPTPGLSPHIVRRRSGGAEHEMSDSVGQYLNEIGMVPLLTAEEERELSQIIEAGGDAASRLEAGERGRELAASRSRRPPRPRTASSGPTCASSSASPAATPCRRAWSCSTSSRRATSASSTPSTSSTGARASSSRPTPPSGSARPSAGPSTRRPAWSASPAIARPACAPPCARCPATATSSTTSTPACTG